MEPDATFVCDSVASA